MAFYEHSTVKDLRAGDRARYWFPPDARDQVAKVGTILGFIMTTEGEVVRMHVDGMPNNETSMLLTSAVFFVSRGS